MAARVCQPSTHRRAAPRGIRSSYNVSHTSPHPNSRTYLASGTLTGLQLSAGSPGTETGTGTGTRADKETDDRQNFSNMRDQWSPRMRPRSQQPKPYTHARTHKYTAAEKEVTFLGHFHADLLSLPQTYTLSISVDGTLSLFPAAREPCNCLKSKLI